MRKGVKKVEQNPLLRKVEQNPLLHHFTFQMPILTYKIDLKIYIIINNKY